MARFTASCGGRETEASFPWSPIATCVAPGRRSLVRPVCQKRSVTASRTTRSRTSARRATTAGTICGRSAPAWRNGTSSCAPCSRRSGGSPSPPNLAAAWSFPAAWHADGMHAFDSKLTRLNRSLTGLGDLLSETCVHPSDSHRLRPDKFVKFLACEDSGHGHPFYEANSAHVVFRATIIEGRARTLQHIN